uniref:DHC_N2 domain-containing protein n=1 Tax=Globodera pallida TaxID=36090 RepID=A0A183BSL8_GLOPA
MSSPSAADPTPTDVPSTSLFTVRTISAKMEMLTTTAKNRWEQALGQFRDQLGSQTEHLPKLSLRTVTVPVFGEARLAEWRAGCERVKDIYRLEHNMEWRIIKMAFWSGFGTACAIISTKTKNNN